MGLFPEEGNMGPSVGVADQPSERTTTPANVPSISSIPDGTSVLDKKLDSRPIFEDESRKPSTMEAQAKREGKFATTLVVEVTKLSEKGIQPWHVEGRRANRDHKLFVYDLSEARARELLA